MEKRKYTKRPARTFVIGDIHGNIKALKQVLKRCKFRYKTDRLITLGDIVDGYPYSYECVEELLKIKNRIDIRGNHDDWFVEYINTGIHPTEWTQGGRSTRDSYLNNAGKQGYSIDSMWGSITALNPGDIPESHKKFFRNQVYYFIDKQNRCFVHGGFDRDYPIDTQHVYTLFWDRDLWEKAMSCRGDQKLKTVDDFTTIFIGHTHVDNWRNPQAKPLFMGGVWNLDTGAGFSGKLTLMNVDTFEYYQSDHMKDLYETYQGR